MYVLVFMHCVLVRQTLTVQASCSIPKNSCNCRISFVLIRAQRQIVTGVKKSYGKTHLKSGAEFLISCHHDCQYPLPPDFCLQEYRSPIVFPVSNGGQLHPGATINIELLIYTLDPALKHFIKLEFAWNAPRKPT